MSIAEVRKALESYKGAKEEFPDIFSIEDYEIILTEKSVYRGKDISCSRTIASTRLLESLEKSGVCKKIEPGVYQYGKGRLTIIKGDNAFVLDKLSVYTHNEFVKNELKKQK